MNYQPLDGVKLLIVPSWLEDAAKASRVSVAQLVDPNILRSILTQTDYNFYMKQLDYLLNPPEGYSKPLGFITPMDSLFESFEIAHSSLVTYTAESPVLGSVKNNTLYGKGSAGYDFFAGRDMLGYLPRSLSGSVTKVKVDPIVTVAAADVLVLSFGVGVWDEHDPHGFFIKATCRLLNNYFGFDKFSKTKLFNYYSQL